MLTPDKYMSSVYSEVFLSTTDKFYQSSPTEVFIDRIPLVFLIFDWFLPKETIKITLFPVLGSIIGAFQISSGFKCACDALGKNEVVNPYDYSCIPSAGFSSRSLHADLFSVFNSD